MKHFIRITSVVIALWAFLLSPALFASVPFIHVQAKAALPPGQWMGKNHGIDNDAVLKNPKSMSKTPFGTDSNVHQYIDNYCLIYTVVGPDDCTNDPEIAAELQKNTAIGNITQAMALMYTYPQADLALWIKDTAVTLGFAPKQVMAQGVGFNGLTPMLPIWKAFRNIAYVLLALSMVIIGFMVMMRKKIDPKTVVTVQNALPRIVMCLILITFSYAIVGLFIDLMYLLIAFINVIMRGALPDNSLFQANLTSGGLTDLMFGIFGALNKWNPASQIIPDLVAGNFDEVLGDIGRGLISSIGTLGPLFTFILLLAYLYAFIKILFMLLSSYTQVLLAVLTGPLQILVDVFPGADGFTSWIKNIVANLAVFPITIFMLLLANTISQQFDSSTQLWTPPLLPQAFGGIGGIAQALISLGIILSIPNIANAVKESLKAKSPFEAGPGMIFGPLGRGIGTAVSTGYQFSMIGSFLGQKAHPPSK